MYPGIMYALISVICLVFTRKHFFLHIYFDGAGYLVSEITVKIG